MHVRSWPFSFTLVALNILQILHASNLAEQWYELSCRSNSSLVLKHWKHDSQSTKFGFMASWSLVCNSRCSSLVNQASHLSHFILKLFVSPKWPLWKFSWYLNLCSERHWMPQFSSRQLYHLFSASDFCGDTSTFSACGSVPDGPSESLNYKKEEK